MKNLKKVLALVLAFAMAFTMMATAGAAYTDSADIEATEAVDMLTALGIMSGDGDGTFRPNDTITRAEACRMIYSIRTGSDDASAYADMQTTFTDVSSDAWYAGYVKHCQAAGIVSGTSATTFEPNRDVTTVELALMCLRVMGYDPDKADIGGSTWSTKTISIATEAGILKDVNTSATAACPRQYAAQLMYNMIQAHTVQWSDDKNGYSDQNLVGNYYDTVGVKYLKLYINVGTLEEVDGSNLTISMTSSDISDSDTTDTEFTNLSTDYSSLLGQKVKVLFRDEKTNDVIGVYPTSDSSSYTVAFKDVEQDSTKVKFNSTSYSFDDSTLQIQVLETDGTITTKDVTSSYFDADTNAITTAMVTFVDNDGDGKFNRAFITMYDTAEVTYVGSDRITAGSTYKMEDHNISEDLVADDWAMISWNRYDECKDIEKAEIVADALDSTKSKTGYEQFEIGGVWYNISEDEADNVSVGDDVVAYVVAGVIVSIDTDDGTGAIPTNIAVVVGNGGSGNTLYGDQAKLRYFDGTLTTVTTTTSNGGISGSDTDLGTAYKVSGSTSATKLTNLTTDTKYNGFTYVADSADASPAASTINGTRVADTAVIILWDANGNSKVVTGKQYNSLSDDQIASGDDLVNDKAASAVFTKDTDGLTRVRLAAVQVKDINDTTGTSNDHYAYILKDAVQKADYIQYTVWTDENEEVVVREENAETTERMEGMLLGYSSIDTDSYIQDVNELGYLSNFGTDPSTSDVALGANKASSTKMIAVGDNQLNVTADTKVLMLDTDNAEGVPYTYGSTTLTTARKDANGEYTIYNVAYILDENLSDNEADLELLVIDTTGAFDFAVNDDEDTDTDTDTDEDDDDTVTSDNVTVTGLSGVTINTSRIMTGMAQVVLDVEDEEVNGITGDATVKVDGVNAATSSVETSFVDGQIQVTVSDAFVTSDSTISVDLSGVSLVLKTYSVTGVTHETITDSTASTQTFSITADEASYTKGATVTLTITLGEAVPTDKAVTVSFTDPDIDDVVIAAGETTATATFTITGDVTIAATATEADAE